MDEVIQMFLCLYILCVIGDPLQGFCNGILFVVFVGEVRMHLYATMERIFGFKWLNYCGLICCCYYCCSCVCKGCNECFECCLLQKQGIQYNNRNNINLYYNYSPNGPGAFNYEYSNFASRYQFLPRNSHKEQNDKILRSGNDPMINVNHPIVVSPSISRE